MVGSVALSQRRVAEHGESEKVRRDAERAIERVHEAAERIRRMTELYRERLEGTRRG